MTIRFQCPSCRQPLEIDQQWAGQSVACPYCKRVVSAPTSSTWEPLAEVPTARPAAPGFAPPLPPAGMAPARTMQSGNRAGWALTLAIFGVALMVFGIGIWMVMLGNMVQQRLGSNATEEEIRQVAQEIMAHGRGPRSPIVGAAILIATVCSISALVLAISALIRQEQGRGKATLACILSALLLFCQLGLILVAMAGRTAAAG